MRPVMFAAFGAVLGGVIGAATGLFISGTVYRGTAECFEGTCTFYGGVIAITGLFIGAVIGALLGIRISGPGVSMPPDPEH
jgi:hypothetical protein